MVYNDGDRVLFGPTEYVVEIAYYSGGTQYLAVVRADGFRQVLAANEVVIAPPKKEEDPDRRRAVDRILVFKGVPRGDLFEYPYNEHESRTRIKDAEKLLDDLLAIVDPA